MIDLLMQIIVIVLASIPLHEFGHWFVARRYGWNPHIERFWGGFQVVTEPVEINSLREFGRFYRMVAKYNLAGSAASILALSIAQIFNIFTPLTFFSLFVLHTVYGWFEVLQNPIKEESKDV